MVPFGPEPVSATVSPLPIKLLVLKWLTYLKQLLNKR